MLYQYIMSPDSVLTLLAQGLKSKYSCKWYLKLVPQTWHIILKRRWGNNFFFYTQFYILCVYIHLYLIRFLSYCWLRWMATGKRMTEKRLPMEKTLVRAQAHEAKLAFDSCKDPFFIKLLWIIWPCYLFSWSFFFSVPVSMGLIMLLFRM